MLAETDCSCATRFGHGLVGGVIWDQRQILGHFARNDHCVYYRCGSRYFNQWIWAKNLKSVKTFRKSLVTYMKRFEDNNHVFSVRLCLPEAIFWLRGEMMGQKWVKSEIHHFSIVGYNSPIKCAIWVHNTILETSGHLLFSSKPENGQKWPKISTWRHPSRKPKNWPSSANLENLHDYCFFFGFFTLNPFKINEYIAIYAHNYVIQPLK